jgi:hypothetical protein
MGKQHSILLQGGPLDGLLIPANPAELPGQPDEIIFKGAGWRVTYHLAPWGCLSGKHAAAACTGGPVVWPYRYVPAGADAPELPIDRPGESAP